MERVFDGNRDGRSRLSKIGWYARRVRAMPFPELPWRVWRLMLDRWESLHPASRSAPDPVCAPGPGCLLPGDPTDRAALLATMDDWLDHGVPFFAASWSLKTAPDWSRCLATGTVAPKTFGMRIDYRDESLVGDIKYVWEPARFQFAVPLGQAWRLTQDERYLEALRQQISSFVQQNPHPMGVHWSSVYCPRVLGQWFDGIRFYAAASSPTRSRRTWAGLR